MFKKLGEGDLDLGGRSDKILPGGPYVTRLSGRGWKVEISRRGVLGGIVWVFSRGLVGGQVRAGSTRKSYQGGETVQDLISQIWSLEDSKIARFDYYSKSHIQAIEDRIRVKLLMSGLSCIYIDRDHIRRVCILHTQTGDLLTISSNLLSTERGKKELKKIGVDGLDINKIPLAWKI